MAQNIRYTPPEGADCDEVHTAIFDGATKPLLALLERTDRCWNPNRPDVHGWTYLMHACWLHRDGIVRLLLGCRADVNLTGCATKVTPLHLAFARSDAALAARLLLMGADAHAVMYPSAIAGSGDGIASTGAPAAAPADDGGDVGGSGDGHGGERGVSQPVQAGGGATGAAADVPDTRSSLRGRKSGGGGSSSSSSAGGGVKPHAFQNQAFTAEVVAEFKNLQVEEPQLARQRLWQTQDAAAVLGSSARRAAMPVDSDAAAAVLLPPAPPEPRGVSVGTTAAMRALISMPAPDIAAVGVDLERLAAGGILRPPPFPT